MWSSAFWWHGLADEEVRRGIEELRQDTLKVLIWLAAASYLAWHFARPFDLSTRLEPLEVTASHWLLFLIVVTGLATSYVLHQWHARLGAAWFLASSVLSITAALWLLATPLPLILYPLVGLAAVVLLHPMAALATTSASLALLASLWTDGRLGFLDGQRLVETGLASLLTIGVGWALGRNMVTAVEWSSARQAEAWKKTQEARVNRAELARALKQLDEAYYRLSRANASLELAWKAADAAERSKSEFVTNISHELRTPLNLIAGFSELILASPENYGMPLPAAYRGDLHAIYRNAQHLLTLANDVIDLARVGVGRLALARELVDLGQIVEDACDIVRQYVEAKGLWLRVDIGSDLPAVTADRLRIRQVLLNLLTNAARFTEEGGITVSAAREDEEIKISVADTGPGIAAEELGNVFTEFYHGTPTAAREPSGLGGVGLGLPLSKRFVELHHGRMGVRSVLGTGTTFWFTLPVAPPIIAQAWDPSWAIQQPVSSGGAERILVLAGADDQLSEFLQRHLNDYQVVVEPDLEQAIARAVDVRALAILADVDDAKGVRRASAPVPVLRLPLPHGERQAIRSGASAYLSKPITRAKLDAALARLDRPLRHLLLVDDDPDFVRLVTRMLRAGPGPADFTIRSAHTGREALDAMATSRPDLVLLDLVMPDLRGNDVLAAMRASGQLADVPVILISGQDQIGEQSPLYGELSLLKPEGFQLDEELGAVEALLRALRPPRQYLTAEAP